MLIICENYPDGSTPAKAIPFVLRRAYNRRIPFVRYRGCDSLPAGVYFQRYHPVFESGRQKTYYIPQRLELDDFIQESANADHPGDQS